MNPTIRRLQFVLATVICALTASDVVAGEDDKKATAADEARAENTLLFIFVEHVKPSMMMAYEEATK